MNLQMSATTPEVPVRILMFVAGWGMVQGCAECHRWDDVVIDASAASDGAGGLARVASGVDTFRAWTGRETTCVDRVDVVDTLEDAAIGRYTSVLRHIEVEAAAEPAVTTHEFCHALDDEEGGADGWVSTEGADVLAAYASGIDPVDDPSEGARRREAFALICEQGPQAAALAEDLYGACGIVGNLDALRFVRDIAFPDAATSVWGELAAPVAYASTTGTIAGTGATTRMSATAATGGDGVYVLETHVDAANAETPVRPVILRLTADAREVMERLELPPRSTGTFRGNPNLGDHMLLGGTSAPIVYTFAGTDAGTAWRVRTDPLRLEPLAMPAMPEDLLPEGFAHGDSLLLRDVGRGLYRLDLSAGTVEEVDTRPFVATATRPGVLAIHGDAAGTLVALAGPAGPAVLAFDDDAAPLWTRDVPVLGDRVRSMFRGTDGSVTLTLSVPASATLGGEGVPVTVRYDPSNDRWSRLQGTCGALIGEHWLTTTLGPLRIEVSDATDASVLAWTRLAP